MMNRYMLMLAVLVAGGMLAFGCGPDGTGGGSFSGGSPDSGNVTFSIKDAPLADLQSLTIDVTGATLLGSAGTPDFQVFPQTGSPSHVTVDLLGLQGFGQLLASANVPVGVYRGLHVDFDNPQAEDNASNPQVITAPASFMTGAFRPPLTVAAGSLQSVVIDVNLERSYHDLGGNEGLLLPVVELGVIPASATMPLERFFARVDTIDTMQDSFTAHVVHFGSGGGYLGTVTIQCDSNTIFNDPVLGISVGDVTDELDTGDVLMVDGVQGATAIEASVVTRRSRSPHAQQPPAQSPPPVPSFRMVSGTILDVDTALDQVTVRVRGAVGVHHSPRTDVTLDVASTATFHRGGTAVAFGDLQPGNFSHITLDPVSGMAEEIEEVRSFVCGTVDDVDLGGGAGGTNRIEFTPGRVNQIPASALAFVPSPLTVDLPLHWPVPQVNERFCVFAFFEGTAHLTFAHPAPNPPVRPQSVYALIGVLEDSTTATINASNELEMSLYAYDRATATRQVFDVTVLDTAHIVVVDGRTVTTGSLQDAARAINSGEALIQVQGSSAPSGLTFTGDIALRVVMTQVMPLPPVRPPHPPAPQDQAIGVVASTAVVNASGDIEFELQSPPPRSTAWNVTVDQNATIQLVSMGTVTVLTVAEAVTELNSSPAPFVRVMGTATGTDFDAHHSLTIHR
jgi:hypothetical protein